MAERDGTKHGSSQMADDATEVGLRTGGTTRRRRIWLIPAALFLGALVVSGVIASTSQPSSSRRPSSSKAAPQFQLVDLRDPTAQVALSQFRGRPVVINFWASWCVPCRKEMPALEAVYERVKDRIAFVGVNHLDTRSDALAFLRKTRVRYPVGFDPDGNTATAYGLFGIPTTIFIDGAGREVERHLGQIGQDDLQHTLDRLFPAKHTARAAHRG